MYVMIMITSWRFISCAIFGVAAVARPQIAQAIRYGCNDFHFVFIDFAIEMTCALHLEWHHMHIMHYCYLLHSVAFQCQTRVTIEGNEQSANMNRSRLPLRYSRL